MKRIAFFVEGQTEQIFLNRLVKEILGAQHTSILLKQFRGGTNIPKQDITIIRNIAINPRYEILISDCGSDNRVKSEILDNIASLRKNNYSMIVGVRDLYPIPIDELPKLEKGLRFLPNSMKDEAGYFDIIIAVHEVETWFLADTTHLRKVDRRLTGSFIKKHLGFDPYAINPETRKHPAKDLNDIYKLVGKSYTKRHWQVRKLVNRLDMNYLRNHVRYDLASLNHLITVLEKFKSRK
ncbi:DUF4276 family protein [Dysgonomonas sp. 25]|uniref:DUF4276 family protein n=1 Tax=Dysgonomonas sp. 25 TaxID=2302933 RepID=UPI0013D7188C|nr:DUF4276 family protein [Dysgonomonas sp. 25]NDV67649.1 DUF4276 family protein [Dysgonomonas sp. 25]